QPPESLGGSQTSTSKPCSAPRSMRAWVVSSMWEWRNPRVLPTTRTSSRPSSAAAAGMAAASPRVRVRVAVAVPATAQRVAEAGLLVTLLCAGKTFVDRFNLTRWGRVVTTSGQKGVDNRQELPGSVSNRGGEGAVGPVVRTG